MWTGEGVRLQEERCITNQLFECQQTIVYLYLLRIWPLNWDYLWLSHVESVNECSLYKCQKGTLTFQLGWIRNVTSTLFSCEQWVSSSHRSFNSGKSQGRVSSSLKSRHHFSKTASSCPGQSCPHKVYSGKPFRIFDQNKERHDGIKLQKTH